VQEVREPLITLLPGRNSHPQNGALSAPVTGHKRRAGPALADEDSGLRRSLHHWQLKRVLPDDIEGRAPLIPNARHAHALPRGSKTELRRKLRLPFQHKERTALDTFLPQRCFALSTVPEHVDAGRLARAGRKTDRAENRRPGAWIVARDVKRHAGEKEGKRQEAKGKTAHAFRHRGT